MPETMLLIPVRTSRQGTSLNAGKLKSDYQDETTTIEIHSDDMSRLGLEKGDKVRMSAANGAKCIVKCKVQKGADATAGLVFMAYGPISSQFMDSDTAGTGMPISKQLEITLEGPLAEDGSIIQRAPSIDGACTSDMATSPLNSEQISLLNNLTASELNATQAIWLSGYFAGMSGSALAAGNFASVASEPAGNLPLMTVLFGSETGNGEGLAEALFAKAKAAKFNVVLEDMMNYDFSKLSQEQLLFVIVSTQGEGDPPLPALKLHSHLKEQDDLALSHIQYAVLALGDSSYEFFCQTGKDFDSFLEKHSAVRLFDRLEADVDFEEQAEEWMEQVLECYQAHSGGSQLAETGAAASAESKKSGYSKTNPYQASVLKNINLNGEGSAKETRHIEIDLAESGLVYEPGDALGVYPLNNPDYVDDLLVALTMTGDERVTVGKLELALRDALIQYMDITALSRVNMQKFAEIFDSEALRTLLDDTHKKEFKDYVWGRQILDLVEDFKTTDIPAQAFIDGLRKIPARLYSIASSLIAHPQQVHLLVGAVRYHSFDRDREGVCSTFLSGRVHDEEKLAVYVQPNKHFHLPDNPDTPVIMVGPGTGLAPFRAFLEERIANNAKGKNWLFFGDQHQNTDFLYAEEMEKMLSDGVLTHLSLAFSRDQEEKIYVQNRIMEQSEELYQWLEDGAYFYICGDAERMANDVHNALIATVAKHGNKSHEEAEIYVNELLDARRYQRDVY